MKIRCGTIRKELKSMQQHFSESEDKYYTFLNIMIMYKFGEATDKSGYRWITIQKIFYQFQKL